MIKAKSMKRCEIRDMKRAVRLGCNANASEEDRQLARASAIRLLDRSISSGHRRLALIRLAEAIRLGATVTHDQWKYCEAAVQKVKDGLPELVWNASTVSSAARPNILRSFREGC